MAIINLSNTELGTSLKYDSISKHFIFVDGKGNEIIIPLDVAEMMAAKLEDEN